MTTSNECKHAPGTFVPRIDRNRCEGKDECALVCPYQVFEVRKLSETERAGLSLGGHIKSFFHGYRQAFADGAERCRACGLCVSACPEHAISLVRSAAAA